MLTLEGKENSIEEHKTELIYNWSAIKIIVVKGSRKLSKQRMFNPNPNLNLTITQCDL